MGLKMEKMQKSSAPALSDVRLTGGLLGRTYENMREFVIPYMWDILNDSEDIQAADMFAPPDSEDGEVYPSHCIANFRIAAGEQEGHFYGMVFQDSDLAKWLEAVAYMLAAKKDEALEAQADEVIDLIARAQEPDGYLNTYFTLVAPDKKFTDLCECHELYTAGHMMEAAAAYYQATGKRKLLDVMMRMAKLINSKLGPAETGKLPGYPGHEEIELALVKMYEATGKAWLLDLAKFFIDERGKKPLYFEEELKRRNYEGYLTELQPPYGLFSMGPEYEQYHAPVREQTEVLGHAVRCMYLACGMVDVARETGDQELLEAAKRLFRNLTGRKMYVTGGIGSSADGERFTGDWDLPNNTVYAETCASVGLIFFAQRLLALEPDGVYADVIERALYNTCMASMSLDGKTFFYVNPLEVEPEFIRRNPDLSHVRPVRPQWFGCACCPPNLARMIASLGKNIYGIRNDMVYLHLYVPNEADLKVGGKTVRMKVETDYPREMKIRIRAGEGTYRLALRIPNWSTDKWCVTVNGQKADAELINGYALLSGDWTGEETVELALDDRVRRIYANPHVSTDVGRVAVQYGPLVYCLEQADNGPGLQTVCLPADAAFTKQAEPDKLGGIVELRTEGLRVAAESQDLYRFDEAPVFEKCALTFIPYYTWANRGENEMTVWVHEQALRD